MSHTTPAEPPKIAHQREILGWGPQWAKNEKKIVQHVYTSDFQFQKLKFYPL